MKWKRRTRFSPSAGEIMERHVAAQIPAIRKPLYDELMKCNKAVLASTLARSSVFISSPRILEAIQENKKNWDDTRQKIQVAQERIYASGKGEVAETLDRVVTELEKLVK